MDIEKLFNEEVMSLDTYIMFKLKEQTAKLKAESYLFGIGNHK